MIIVTYDIADDKLRLKVAKFLEKHGRRLQYSVFELKNSKRILGLIQEELYAKFAKKFSQSDSVIVFEMSSRCKVYRYGYAANDDEDLVVVG